MTNPQFNFKRLLLFIATIFAFTTIEAQDQTDAPTIFPKGGLYSGTQTITMAGPTGATIYFTTDGSVPTFEDAVYTGPFNITSTTPLRAVAIVPNEEPSIPQTETYLYNVNHTFAIVSVVADPFVLFDPATGLYPNFTQDIEEPANIEMFEPDGQQAFSQLIELEISGTSSATNAQKSLAIKAKGSLGGSKIEYPVFPGGDFDEYRSLILRNSGQDWNFKMFHDAFVSGLIREDEDVQNRILPARVNHQDYRPGVLYINGEYWGIHNIRERTDKRYIRVHFGLDDDEIDFIDEEFEVKEGDLDVWKEMQSYLQTANLSGNASLNTIRSFVDIEKYMDNVVFNLYVDNADWPGNNNRKFRARDGGTFEWLLKDHDFTFGMYTSESGAFNSGYAGSNSLARLKYGTGVNWPSPEWSNRLFNKLLQNDSWRHDFINRMADQINVFYDTDRMLQRIDEYETIYQPEIQQHFDRWKEGFNVHAQDVDIIRNFANNRTANVYNHFIDAFDEVNGTADITINASPSNGGSVNFSTVNADNFYQGTWFRGVPIPISAIPAPGYVFTGWSGLSNNLQPNTSLTLFGNGTLTANFAPIDSNCTDADNDGVCAESDCNDLDPSIPATPNTSCNDGDPQTTNDVIQSDGCTCLGEAISQPPGCNVVVTSGQGSLTVTGLTNAENAKLFDVNFTNLWECNPWFGNACTGNEVITGLVSGANYFLSVQSGECNEWIPVTVQGGVNTATCIDGIQNQGETGIDCGGPCAPCQIIPTCFDGIQNQGETGIDCGGPCAPCQSAGCNIDMTSSNGSLTITGLTAAENTKLFDANFNIIWDCNPWFGNTCSGNEVVNGLISGATYFLSVQSSNCEEWIPVIIQEETCGDTDGDGVCNQDDCQPTNANFPTTPGTPCNDFNNNTSNDVIQPDGCSCLGSVVNSSLPDLWTGDYTPLSGMPGESVSFIFDVINQGDLSTGAYNITSYISTDQILSNNDIQAGNITTGNTQPGILQDVESTITIPSGLTPGNYFVITLIDSNNTVTESDESNNIASTTLEVIGDNGNENGGCNFSTPSGYTLLGDFGNSKYLMSNNSVTFFTAQAEAASFGGHLASITTPTENEFIRSNLNGNIVLIGLNDVDSEGNLVWDSGESFDYNNLGVTNNSGVDVGTMNFWNGEWGLDGDQVQRRYILEIPCELAPRVSSIDLTNTLKINNIFPNPTTGEFFIQFEVENDVNVNLSISNLSGQKIMNQNFDLETGSNAISIDLEDQPNGVYQLSILNDREMITRKIIKQDF